MNVGIQGLAGSFSEQAACAYFEKNDLKEPHFTYCTTFPELFSRLMNGEIAVAVSALHNNTMGFVEAALAEIAKNPCELLEVFSIDIEQCLLVRPGTLKEHITHVISQEPALRQCPQYLHREFPNAIIQNYSDTTTAAKDLAAGILPHTAAAIGPKQCGQLYGLSVLAEGIQDLKHNSTTFVALKKS